MTNSMTGFASGDCSTEYGDLVWELRTVNHRYLETHFKLPDGFRGLEPALRDLTAGKLKRGKLDATLQFRAATQAKTELQINEALAIQVIRQAENLATKIADPEEFSGPGYLTLARCRHRECHRYNRIVSTCSGTAQYIA